MVMVLLRFIEKMSHSCFWCCGLF